MSFKKNRKKKYLVFGYFGYVTNQLDGQTIKTRNVYKLLKDNCTGPVHYSDTQQFRYGLKPIFQFFKYLVSCDYLVILPCLNNLKTLFPVLYVLSKIFNYQIIHIGIGGWHDKYLKQWPLVRNMLGEVRINLLETEITVERLRSQFKYTNVAVFPNFRFDECLHKSKSGKSCTINLVFMARVNMKKGLDTLADLCGLIFRDSYSNKLTLTIYGPIGSDEDKEYLQKEIVDKYEFVVYGGALSPDRINETLSNYDIFLFPTHYFTEGFPGSILDAYNAGIPVLATAWEHARQFVSDGVTGYVVDFENPVPELYNHIKHLCDSPEKLWKMKLAASNESLKYTPSSAWKILKQYIDHA